MMTSKYLIFILTGLDLCVTFIDNDRDSFIYRKISRFSKYATFSLALFLQHGNLFAIFVIEAARVKITSPMKISNVSV